MIDIAEDVKLGGWRTRQQSCGVFVKSKLVRGTEFGPTNLCKDRVLGPASFDRLATLANIILKFSASPSTKIE